MEKILTIVIPSYNVESYLDEVMPHYLDARFIDKIELLIVNDGSSDRTAEIAAKYQDTYPNSVRLINKENGGHGSTINTGIVAAKGRYFKVIDGDDWVDTESFCEFVNKLQITDVDIILTPFNRVYISDGTVAKVDFGEIEVDKILQVSDTISNMQNCYQIHSTTFRTELIRKVPAISEHCFYVDQEYVLFPLKYAKTVIIYDLAIYQYRLGTANQSVSMENRRKNISMHEHVTLKIANYIKDNSFSDEVRMFLVKRVAGLASWTLATYLSFADEAVAKSGWIDFYNQLKAIDSSFVTAMEGKKAKALRMSNNALFGVFFRMSRKD